MTKPIKITGAATPEEEAQIREFMEAQRESGVPVEGATLWKKSDGVDKFIAEYKPDVIIMARTVAGTDEQVELAVMPLSKEVDTNHAMRDLLNTVMRGDKRLSHLSSILAHVMQALEERCDHEDIITAIKKCMGEDKPMPDVANIKATVNKRLH